MDINSIIEFFNKAIFSAVSNISAIAGLFISIFVLIRVKRIEKNYILRFRVPDLTTKLDEQADNLVEHLNDYTNFINDIKAAFARSKAHLESLQGKVDRRTKKTIKSLLKQMSKYSESHEQLDGLASPKKFLYRVGIFHLDSASREELRGDRKREAVYKIYEDMLTLTEEINNAQEDRRLD